MMWRVSPAKLARNAPASLFAIMPAITTRGRDTRSSRSPKAAIVELMPAEQFWRGQIHQAALVLIDQPPALHADVPALARREQRGAHAPGLLFDHSHHLARLVRRYHGHAAIDDRGFLAGDGLKRIAEKLGVVR